MNECIKGIFKLKNGNWKCDKIYNGVRITKICSTKNEILTFLKQKILEIDNMKNEKLDSFSKVPTLQEIFDLYKISHNWSLNTIKKGNGYFNTYFDDFKDKPVSYINNNILLNWITSINNLINTGKIKIEYANKILRLMKNLLKIAFQNGFISHKVNIDLINLYKNTNSISEKIENNYLNYDEFILFCNELLKLNYRECITMDKREFVFVLKFLYYTGTRINEARAVQVKDLITSIDKKTKNNIYYVLINKQLDEDKNEIKYILKNGDTIGRKVYIESKVYNDLTNDLNYFNLKNDDFIFDFSHENRPYNRRSISYNMKQFIAYLKNAKRLPSSFPDYLSPHGFRRSNTLYLKQLGVSVELAAKMQGHSVSVMLNTYSRVDKNEVTSIFK